MEKDRGFNPSLPRQKRRVVDITFYEIVYTPAPQFLNFIYKMYIKTRY
jgi:hypothetical protein